MAKLQYTIDNKHDGMTVKDYVRKTLGVSARGLISLKKNPDGILINNAHSRSIDVLWQGDILCLNTLEEYTEYQEIDLPIDIVYEDEHYILVNKPSAMTIYKAGNNDVTLLGAVADYNRKKGNSFVFRPLYRLDKDTSGIVVIAKNNLVPQLTELKKEYYAVCEGVTQEQGRIDTPIGLSENSKIIRTTGAGKPAVTNYTRLSTDGKYSLVRLDLETGRTHQIRVHMASIGHPLCGDELYGGKRDIISRQALHCKNVRIINMAIGMDEVFETPYPQDFIKAFPEVFSGLL